MTSPSKRTNQLFQQLINEIWNAGYIAGKEQSAATTPVKYDDMKDGKLYRVTIEALAAHEYGYYGPSDWLGTRLVNTVDGEEIIDCGDLEEFAIRIEEIGGEQ